MRLNFSHKYWRWLLPVLVVAYCAVEASQGTGDFFIYLSAADDLGKHINIFEKKYVDGYHYFYSVFFALLLKPFVHFPYAAVKFFWLLLNGMMFLDLLRMLYNSSFIRDADQVKKDVFIFLVFLASLRFFTGNIHTSQITILILWCSIRGLALIHHNHLLSGSLLLALAINIKLLPIVFIPYLVYRSCYKATALVFIICAALLFVPSLIIGPGYNLSLLSSWLGLINPNQQMHILDVEERSFHGLSTLLSTLLVKNVPDVYAMSLPRSIADVSLETLAGIILIARLVLASFTLYFLRLPVFSRAGSVFQSLAEISYILLIIPLIFPHQQHYAFLFAMPAFALVLHYIMFRRFSKTLGFLLFLIYLAFNLQLLLGEFGNYYDHYKVLTYGALLLIPLTAVIFRRELRPADA